MNFLITNMTGYRNKGCEALTKSIVNEIKKYHENAKFRIFTEDLDYDEFLGASNNISFHNTPFQKYLFGGITYFPKSWQYKLLAKTGLSKSISKGLKLFNEVDAVLSTGGDIFSSTYSNLERHLSPIKVASSYGKPAFLVGHSIGPFENQKEYDRFKKTMKQVPLITVRESLSFKYLQDMNIENSRIELTADPAFCLEPDMTNVDKFLEIYAIPKEKTVVGVVPSHGITSFSGVNYENHVKVLKHLIKFLITELNCHVVLLPHVHLSLVVDDDRVLCELLYRELGFPKNVSVITFSHSAEEIRGLVSTFDLMITERMHAAIAALSHNVPTYVIGYSVKTEGILGDIFGFGSLEEYMISVKKLDSTRLNKQVKNLLDKRINVSKQLTNVMPTIKERARRNFTLILDTIN